jgi:CBS domain containing-hemolysin-like protein
MVLDLAITLLLVLLNGFFVAAEFAFVKVRQSQIELMIRNGSNIAKISKHIINNLYSYLSATQLGITLASLALGWFGEEVVANLILNIFHFFKLHITINFSHQLSLIIGFIVITSFHIIFGELLPKSIAIQRAERTALIASVPIRIFYFIFKPLIWVINFAANRLILLIGLNPKISEFDLHSTEELRLLLEEGTKTGAIEASEHELLENVFNYRDTPAKQIMVPRNKIIGVELSMPPDDIINKFIEEGYSRMPVYEKTIDNIVGIIYAKDLINMMSHRNLILIYDLIRPAIFVKEDDKISNLKTLMQKYKSHLVIALDEFGGTAGLITLEDIVEEIFGEIQDEYDEEQPIVEIINESEFIIKASAAIADVNEFLPLPLPESEDYETVGGLITYYIGKIPKVNESFELEKYHCTILKSTEMSIESIKFILTEKK